MTVFFQKPTGFRVQICHFTPEQDDGVWQSWGGGTQGQSGEGEGAPGGFRKRTLFSGSSDVINDDHSDPLVCKIFLEAGKNFRDFFEKNFREDFTGIFFGGKSGIFFSA